MDYDASLRWLLTLPDFERTGEFTARPDLAPMLALLAELADPHRGRATVHIAGSKGKGSTGAMIEAVLRAAGLRTGHYVSPHLHRYTERIRLDGQPCDREPFAAAMARVRDAMGAVAPQFAERAFVAFDALTAAAFVAFRHAAVDVQIVEVGLGGRLDSTNVFHVNHSARTEQHTADDEGAYDTGTPSTPQTADVGQLPTTNIDRRAHVVVLTPISLEHTAILGDTIPAIAREKADIITNGAAVVVAPQRESALDVFHEVVAERGAEMIEVANICQVSRTSATPEGQQFKLKTPRATYAAQLPLAGRHQLENAATAVVACETLAQRARIELTPAHVRGGLAKLVWPGRLEVLKRKPFVIVDGAHNGDSAKRMVAALRDDFRLDHLAVLFGTLAGKDAAAMAAAVAPIADEAIVAPWHHARAAEPGALADAFRANDVPVTASTNLPDAFEAAVAHAGDRGAVVAFGALAFVAAVREYLLGIESDMIRLATG